MMMKTNWTGELNGNLGHPDKGPVKVLDSLLGVLGGLVAHIANPPLGKEPCVCDLVFAEMLLEVCLTHGGRETSHEDAGGLYLGHGAGQVCRWGGVKKK